MIVIYFDIFEIVIFRLTLTLYHYKAIEDSMLKSSIPLFFLLVHYSLCEWFKKQCGHTHDNKNVEDGDLSDDK